MKAARKVTENVVMYLPRQSNQRQIAALQESPGRVELQYLMCSGSTKGTLIARSFLALITYCTLAVCCYFGDLASPLTSPTTNADEVNV